MPASINNRMREVGCKSNMGREKVDFNTLIEIVPEILCRELRSRKVTVHLDLQEGLPPCPAHSNRLEQVFFNLLTNATGAFSQTVVTHHRQ